MKKTLLVFVTAVMMLSLLAGCSGTSTVSQQPKQENSAKSETTESLNKSYEIYTNFKEYVPFTGLSVGMKLEEVQKILSDGGLVASSELSSVGKDGDRVCTYTSDKANPKASIRIQVNKENILISRGFGGIVPTGTETGFKPTKADYKSVADKITAGSLKTVTDVEAIFGKSFLSEEKYDRTPSADGKKKIIRDYRWYGSDCWVQVMTDETGVFTSYKIGAVGLKD
ncbi:MAG: hypothetical protein ABRQ26_02265 [Syntrophomonadaceae bacterium]